MDWDYCALYPGLDECVVQAVRSLGMKKAEIAEHIVNELGEMLRLDVPTSVWPTGEGFAVLITRREDGWRVNWYWEKNLPIEFIEC